MNITEKVSYIKGLLEGLNLDENKAEVKLISAIVDLLDDMALEVTDIEEDVCEISEQLDEIDEDLGSLEEDFYDCEENEEEFYEVTCPTCGKTICFSEAILCDGEMECPSCGENLEFDFEEICSDPECDCGCKDSECNCNK